MTVTTFHQRVRRVSTHLALSAAAYCGNASNDIYASPCVQATKMPPESPKATLVWKRQAKSQNEQLGAYVSAVPLSEDGSGYVVVYREENQITGAQLGPVCAASTGQVLFYARNEHLPTENAVFPSSVRVMDDIDGDGILDLLVASGPGDPVNGATPRMAIASGRDGRILVRLSEIPSPYCIVAPDYVVVPDCDNDKIRDIVILDPCLWGEGRSERTPRWVLLSGRTGSKLRDVPLSTRTRRVQLMGCGAGSSAFCALERDRDATRRGWLMTFYALTSLEKIAESIVCSDSDAADSLLCAGESSYKGRSAWILVHRQIADRMLRVEILEAPGFIAHSQTFTTDSDVREVSAASLLLSTTKGGHALLVVGVRREAGPGCAVVFDLEEDKLVYVLEDDNASIRFAASLATVDGPTQGIVVGDPGFAELGNFVAFYSLK